MTTTIESLLAEVDEACAQAAWDFPDASECDIVQHVTWQVLTTNTASVEDQAEVARLVGLSLPWLS